MRRFPVTSALAAAATILAALVVGAPASAAPARPAASGTWGKAEELPGSGTLNTGGSADLSQVSCASPGNCVVAGSYATKATAAMLAVQSKGKWAKAFKAPVSVPKNGGYSGINAVSCPSAGNCSAAGTEGNALGASQSFVLNERNGKWSAAKEIPGSVKLNTGDGGGVGSLSCVSPGNCTATGYYEDSSHQDHIYTANERNGTWHQAYQVPGLAALKSGGYLIAVTLSCASTGNCALGGQYNAKNGTTQALIATEKNGTWGDLEEVPGTGVLNADGTASTNYVSCPSAGKCVAVGAYQDKNNQAELFVISESNGHWGTAKEMPGIAGLNVDGRADIGGLSCPSAGNCVAGGQYTDKNNHAQAYVESEKNGHWGNAEELPGTAGLNTSSAGVDAVSCSSAGNCGVAGSYGHGQTGQAFVDNEVGGHWNQAKEVAGSASLNTGGDAMLNSISCKSATACTAAGTYLTHKEQFEAFVVSET
jgi:hypothetical protein